MVVTGGFTDYERSTFPVYAYDMTLTHNFSTPTATTTTTTAKVADQGGKWYVFHNTNNGTTTNNNNSTWPSGRAGHVSAVSSTGDLYIFGGSTYHKGKFQA
mmetsp:Transcript_22714/g.32545  ORF Transcript_22714/g.32545 Transcript_22714/m.32545 type:complete len:101 (-) Transcript_22714:942-1244(-)